MPAAGAALAPSYGAVGAGSDPARAADPESLEPARAAPFIGRLGRSQDDFDPRRDDARGPPSSSRTRRWSTAAALLALAALAALVGVARRAPRAEPDAFGASLGSALADDDEFFANVAGSPLGRWYDRHPAEAHFAPLSAGDRLNDHALAKLFKIAWFPVFRGEFVEDQATLPTHVRDELGGTGERVPRFLIGGGGASDDASDDDDASGSKTSRRKDKKSSEGEKEEDSDGEGAKENAGSSSSSSSARVRSRRAPLGVIAMHGAFGGVRQEQPSAYASVPDQIPVVALDVRGHGESVQGWDRLGVDEAFAHLRWREMANDVVAVADDAGFDRAILGGHSMTNAVAMWACVSPKIRDRVAGVLVVKAASGWGERRDAMCVLREVLRTHAAFAAVLRRADERHAERVAETAGDETEMSSARVALGWETPEERTRRREAERKSEKRESKSVSKHSKRSSSAPPTRRHALWSSKIDAMLREDVRSAENAAEVLGHSTAEKMALKADATARAARRYASHANEWWDHVSPLIPGTYVGDKTSDYPSASAIRDVFRGVPKPAMVIATRWSRTHPLRTAKALAYLSTAAWVRKGGWAEGGFAEGSPEEAATYEADVAAFVEGVARRERKQEGFETFWKDHPRWNAEDVGEEAEEAEGEGEGASEEEIEEEEIEEEEEEEEKEKEEEEEEIEDFGALPRDLDWVRQDYRDHYDDYAAEDAANSRTAKRAKRRNGAKHADAVEGESYADVDDPDEAGPSEAAEAGTLGRGARGRRRRRRRPEDEADDEADDEAAASLAATDAAIEKELEADRDQTLNEWMTFTFGPDSGLDALELEKVCTPGCCQLWYPRQGSKEGSCLAKRYGTKHDMEARATCRKAVRGAGG